MTKTRQSEVATYPFALRLSNHEPASCFIVPKPYCRTPTGDIPMLQFTDIQSAAARLKDMAHCTPSSPVVVATRMKHRSAAA